MRKTVTSLLNTLRTCSTAKNRRKEWQHGQPYCGANGVRFPRWRRNRWYHSGPQKQQSIRWGWSVSGDVEVDWGGLKKRVTELMMDIWLEERFPDEWRTAVIHPLHKKGPRTDINNYRKISPLSLSYKALLSRLNPQVDPMIGEYQGGFRKGGSCQEQILSLTTNKLLQLKGEQECLYLICGL